MTRSYALSWLVAAIIAGLLAMPGAVHGETGKKTCREIRHHPDGKVTEKIVADPEPDRGTSDSSASARASGVGGSRSSVSVSSSNGPGGRPQASSAYSGDSGRSVEVEREGGRCTIRINER